MKKLFCTLEYKLRLIRYFAIFINVPVCQATVVSFFLEHMIFLHVSLYLLRSRDSWNEMLECDMYKLVSWKWWSRSHPCLLGKTWQDSMENENCCLLVVSSVYIHQIKLCFFLKALANIDWSNVISLKVNVSLSSCNVFFWLVDCSIQLMILVSYSPSHFWGGKYQFR